MVSLDTKPRVVVEYIEAGVNALAVLANNSTTASSPYAEYLGQCYRVLAFRCFQMTEQWREPTVQATLTPEFLALILQQIHMRGPAWKTLLCVLGEHTSPGYPWLAQRLIRAEYVQIVLPFISIGVTEAAQVVIELPWTVEEVCLWIVANLSTCAAHSCTIATSLLPLVPSLYGRLGNAPSTATQSYMCAFRAFSALVPAKQVVEQVTPNAIKWLLGEFSLGLQGLPLPGPNFHHFYPSADDRALVVLCSSRDADGRAAFVAAGVISLLVQSAHCKKEGDAFSTARLWAWATEAIHNIAKTKDYHTELLNCSGQGLKQTTSTGLLALAAGRRSSGVHISWATRLLAADAAVALGLRWEVERLLWLAVLKNDRPSRCNLSMLPSTLVRPIMKWLMILEEIDTETFDTIPNLLLFPMSA